MNILMWAHGSTKHKEKILRSWSFMHLRKAIHGKERTFQVKSSADDSGMSVYIWQISIPQDMLICNSAIWGKNFDNLLVKSNLSTMRKSLSISYYRGSIVVVLIVYKITWPRNGYMYCGSVWNLSPFSCIFEHFWKCS